MDQIIKQDFIIQISEIQKLEEINKGGFGVVYKGLMKGNIVVAIKELYNQNITQLAKQELENEIVTAQKMRHSNIITVYGYCQSPLGLVIELLPQSLLNLLLSNKELKWELRYQISLDIAQGLDYLHEKNIIHRDLKSNNVLLDSNLRAKITDFGLSRVKTESKHQMNKQEVGNIRFMAPELICENPKFSKQSDIFALGVIY